MRGLLLILLPCLSVQEEVTFTLGGLGDITGLTTQTKIYPDAPYSDRTYYKFRNLPYAQPFLRFQQSQLWDPSQPLSGDGPYDATRNGALCQQGSMDQVAIEELKNKTIYQMAVEMNPLFGLAISIFINMINSILQLEPDILGPSNGSKTIGAVLHDWLDIDLNVSEDCLHLAVNTPIRPDGTEKKNLPVLFFVHGGAFYGGTNLRMGAERLGAWDDVIVVSINYRLGPLGFMCLDTDEAAGNMGMLDAVTALQWVHRYIGYFGGDPDRVTIFGESAGSAAIGHLLLSDVTTGLFAQGIGQSGSALASWAFEANPEAHSYSIASRVGCIFGEGGVDTDDLLVDCLRQVPAVNISAAFKDNMREDRQNGGLGFGGTIPCAQTKGVQKFYKHDESPEQKLHSGNYERVPIMFGANAHEGSFVYAEVYNAYLAKNNLTEDTNFLKYGLVHQLLQTVKIGNSYPVEYLVEEAYFTPEVMGDLEAMRPAIIDLLGVFFLKASSYEFVVESVDQGSLAYWYSLEYASPDKSAFHAMFMDKAMKAGIEDPGVCHGDELIYLFDLEFPLLLCDTSKINAGITDCLDPLGLTLNMDCINGAFKDRWHWCVTGELTEEENRVSGLMASMWTKFAATGDPGHGARPWTREGQWYSRITTEVEQVQDYRNTYHVAADGGDRTTTPAPPAGCPAGWAELVIGEVKECFLVGNPEEFLTKQDAALICSAYGSGLVEMSDGRAAMVNNFVKNLIHDASDEGSWFEGSGPHWEAQWWIGATCSGHHSEHNYGDWTWDMASTKLEYFDWHTDEPNDYETQNCLAYVPVYNNFGGYSLSWNDHDCKEVARYICMKRAE